MATRQQQRRTPAHTRHRTPAHTQHRRARRASRSGRRWLIGLALVVAVSLFAWYVAVSHDAGPAPSNGNQVAAGTAHHLGGFQPVADQAVPAQGRLPVLFVSAQYCVFCAAERWALVDALERFGTLSQITPSQSAIADGVTSPIPTYDFTRAYVQVSSGYAPSLLQGLSFAQVKQDLTDPTSTVGQTIHREGTRITALICQLTDSLPQTVCQDPAVQADLVQVN